MQLELVNRESGSPPTVIQVIGVGGGGSNAVQRMIDNELEGVQFVMANTDLQALERFQSPSIRMLPLGEKITGGLGAGGNPEVGREAAEEDLERIRELLNDAHMVFVTAGMGGGTGTGAAPVIARAARDLGKLCVAVVTMPFHFEGQRKYQLALEGVEALRKDVDTLIVIPNQLLLNILEPGTSVREAFLNADEVLRMGVKGIADLITQPGEINVDFNDVCTVMRDGGEALMGIGIANGAERADQAAHQALENPLLSGAHMKGATGLLVQITADESFSLEEYSCIMEQINDYVDTDNATVISGIAIDNQKKDEIKVTVIATGFPQTDQMEQFRQGGQEDGRAVQVATAHAVQLRGGRTGVQRSGPNPLRGQGASDGMQNPLQTPLSTPLSARSAARAPYSHEAGQAAQMRQALRPQAQQNGVQGGGATSQSAGTQSTGALLETEAPDRVYRLNEEGSRLAVEQLEQVSNTELELLFSAGPQQHQKAHGPYAEPVPVPATGLADQVSKANQVLGQKRAEPQLPQGQNENLYIPTLLRRKHRKR